jgi:hypothetical protein
MLAVLRCLLAVLMLPGISLARPIRRVASPQTCALGQPTMPDLTGLIPRSSPRVAATGRLIKGLYYSESLNGPHTLAGFFIACDRLLEPKPFLVVDFHTHQFSFDGDWDSCTDTVGLMPLPEIDPADFLSAVDRAGDL